MHLRFVIQPSSGYWNICLKNAREEGNICFNISTEHSGSICAQNLILCTEFNYLKDEDTREVLRGLGGSGRFKYHCLDSLADLLPNALMKTGIR